MEIVDLFMEKSKDKFLNMLIKIPKAYDWYLGIVIKLDDYDEDADPIVNVAVLVHGFVRKDRLIGADKLKSELIHVVNK